jgi:uncharacterized phage protein gp47/JayE
MAYQSRSVRELSDTTQAAYRRELPGTDATLEETVLAVDAEVVAILLKEMDLRIGFLYRQLFASTADAEHLEQRHAYEFGVLRKAASPAGGNLAATGTPGLVFPSGLTFLSGGIIYRSTSDVTIAGDGTVTIPIVATTAGTRGNRVSGEKLALSEPGLFPGLSTEATVTAGGISGGADQEEVESLRARVLSRKRNPPQGGAEADYERFALELSFVSKVWARRLVNGPGSVGVWFLSTGGAIPSGAEVDAVRTSIEARRLIGLRDLRVYAPTAVSVAVTVALTPDTVEIRQNVSLALAAVFKARARPGLPDDPFLLSRSWIAEAISDAVGEDRHTLVSPSADPSFTLGQYPVLGTVSFV